MDLLRRNYELAHYHAEGEVVQKRNPVLVSVVKRELPLNNVDVF
jgi:hypothetical protein